MTLLTENIHKLTRAHLATDPNDGKLKRFDSLLAQLAAACRSTLGAPGGASGGASVPLNMRAVQLERDIREAALNGHYEMRGFEYRGTLVDLLQSFATAEGIWETFLEHATMDWCDQITALLTPEKPRWKPSLECPACGQRFHGEENEPCLGLKYWDEDEKVAPQEQWHMLCAGCGAEWTGKEIVWLLKSLDTREIGGQVQV